MSSYTSPTLKAERGDASTSTFSPSSIHSRRTPQLNAEPTLTSVPTTSGQQQIYSSQQPQYGTIPAPVHTDKVDYDLLCKFYQHYEHGQVADFPSRSKSLLLSYIIDWITLAILGALIFVYFLDPPTMYFRLDDPTIRYPKVVAETVSSPVVVVLFTVIPLAIICLAQIWIRNFQDFHHTLLALLQTFVLTTLVCAWMWFSVGGLRPSFIEMCQPSVPLPDTQSGPIVWYSDEICTAPRSEVNDAKRGFPSGHASSIWCTAVFVFLYLNGKLKLFDGRAHLWKIFICAPIILALFVAFSRVHDGKHTLWQVCFGSLIGILSALLIYRMNFCSLFGPDNHIPCRFLWRARDRRNMDTRHMRHAMSPNMPVPVAGEAQI
eukprot:TRINITY_DN14016_c0_g1_i1.p1 TRINITY_DN14016_c0_g1~~TRINITY_DN14016_c0_g1_i1.p1  ORF type:complete len:412 (+),score=72.55 TRINITY_DN14016_c0_g1_i1:107-1237(+)